MSIIKSVIMRPLFRVNDIIELDLRSEDPGVYSNFIDRVRQNRCMAVFRVLENGQIQFMTHIGTTIPNNVDVEQVGFPVRFITEDYHLDAMLDVHKLYVVAYRESPNGVWHVLNGYMKDRVCKFVKESYLASTRANPHSSEMEPLDPEVLTLGTSYDSLYNYALDRDKNVIKVNRRGLIEAVKKLCDCTRSYLPPDNDMIAGPLLDLINALPEALRMPDIQKHNDDNYFKEDLDVVALPRRLRNMINSWSSASCFIFSWLFGTTGQWFKIGNRKIREEDIQNVIRMFPLIRNDVAKLKLFIESKSLWPPPSTSPYPPPHSQTHSQNQMQFSQSLVSSRHITFGSIQHGLGQSQLNQGNQLNQFSIPADSALLNAAQSTPNTQMYGLSSGSRSLASQNLSDQMFNLGVANPGTMMPLQQQQHVSQGTFGNIAENAQNLQPGIVPPQNTPQNHPNLQQQRQQNQ